MCPTDAWLTVEVSREGVEVLEMADFSGDEVDFSPALHWAACCTVEGTPAVPDGWRLEVVGSLDQDLDDWMDEAYA